MLWFYESFFPWSGSSFVLYWQIKACGYQSHPLVSSPQLGASSAVLIFLIAIVLPFHTSHPVCPALRPALAAGYWPFWLGAAVNVAGLLSPSGRASTSAPLEPLRHH